MAWLFDTDAISEVLRPRPLPAYVAWLQTVCRVDQFTSAVAIGELYRGAFRSEHRKRHLENIDGRVLPVLTVLGYDTATARLYGHLAAELESIGLRLADADLQIAATAIRHDLELVTGNVKHFERIKDLKLCRKLAEARTTP